jgi:hypothetical protein
LLFRVAAHDRFLPTISERYTLAHDSVTENAAKLCPREKDRYDPFFLSAMLSTPFCQQQISSQVGQVTIGKLALFRIERIRFPLPSISLQQACAQIQKRVVDHLTKLEQAFTTTDVLFSALQRQMFEGSDPVSMASNPVQLCPTLDS